MSINTNVVFASECDIAALNRVFGLMFLGLLIKWLSAFLRHQVYDSAF